MSIYKSKQKKAIVIVSNCNVDGEMTIMVVFDTTRSLRILFRSFKGKEVKMLLATTYINSLLLSLLSTY